MLGFIQISAVSLIEISTYSQYQQREKRSKKEKITTTILVFYQKTTMVIIGIVLMSAYNLRHLSDSFLKRTPFNQFYKIYGISVSLAAKTIKRIIWVNKEAGRVLIVKWT